MPDAQCVQSILNHLLKAYSPLAIAYSGGLDSRFLAFMAKKVECEGVASHLYFFKGPHMSEREVSEAENWATNNGMALTILELNPLDDPEVRGNEQDRCYHCKRLLFQALFQEVTKNPPFPGQDPTLCDGSNTTDRQGFRPGQRALKELSVHSPLAEAGLGKEDVRRIGKELGLDNPEQQARPCLLTRFAYGLAAEEKVLQALDRGEAAIFKLLNNAVDRRILKAMPDFRLRLTSGPSKGNRLADYQTELHLSGPRPPEDLCAAMQETVAEQGFPLPHITSVDAISGHFDRSSGIEK